MKAKDLTEEQKEELEKFGANTWFVEYLHKQYEDNPSGIPEQWKNFFDNDSVLQKDNGNKNKVKTPTVVPKQTTKQSEPGTKDELKLIAGSSAKILENMNTSLKIPVATSQRTIPVKLLAVRFIINS